MRISLFKRQQKHGWTWVLQWSQPNGRIKTKNLGQLSKRDAELIKAQMKMELTKKQYSIFNKVEKIKLSELTRRYINSIKMDHSINTIKTTNNAANIFIKLIGDLYINTISFADIENWRSKRKKYGRKIINSRTGKETGRGIVSIATLNIDFRHLKVVLNYGIKHKYIEYNPFNDMKELRINKKIPPVLPIKDIKKFISSIQTIQDLTFFLLLYYTGARPSEIARLKPSDVIDSHIQLLNTKGKSDRVVYVPNRILQLLNTLIENSGSNSLSLFPLYCNDSGRPAKRMKILLKKAGISENYTPKWFRHTFSTNASKIGKDIYAVKNIVGHANISTTEGYTHYDTDVQINIIESLPKIETTAKLISVVPE